MALTLSLQFFEQLYRHCAPAGESAEQLAERRLAQLLLARCSLLDLIRWRRVSRAFRQAADARLRTFTRVDLRVYRGLERLHSRPPSPSP